MWLTGMAHRRHNVLAGYVIAATSLLFLQHREQAALGNTKDVPSLVQRAYENQNFVDPFSADSPLSSVPSSPFPSPPGSPKLSPNVSSAVRAPDMVLTSTTLPGSNEEAAKGSRSKWQSKECRKQKHAEEKEDLSCYEPPPDTKCRHLELSAHHVKVVDVDLNEIHVAANGYTGYHGQSGYQPGEYTLEQMCGPDSDFDFDLVEWDASRSLPVIDRDDTLLMIGVSNPAAAFNFGPCVISLDHADYENYLDGFCAITALCPSEGGYDYKKGGHLILWDLHLVIEFPPGATILLPSAILRHSNVAIGPNER
ncbi:hypothetical protein Moror_9523 [Moniliophthora roreri MCA 2997]|uniref:Uncharacterized protein n=2 Tax=Moniliophthora roreri TaxID=221103 RepID=V2WWF1_MONRO|nr:hypothetical protein Moror_9523 [Moniliophthora roreri MCA 2997]